MAPGALPAVDDVDSVDEKKAGMAAGPHDVQIECKVREWWNIHSAVGTTRTGLPASLALALSWYYCSTLRK